MRLEKNHDFIGSIFSLLSPCKLVFCFQDVTEEKKTCKGERKKSGKGNKTTKTQSHVKPLTVLEVSNKQTEVYAENKVKEEKKKKKNVAKR